MAMASHATWYNDCLPSTFPPASGGHQHGLMSTYSPDFLTSDSQLDISVEGGKLFNDDDFIYPLTMRPSPVSFASHSLPEIEELKDPLLCVTPEKSKGPLKRTCMKGGRDTGRVDMVTDKTAPKVHFDSTVEVKQMSPDYSSIEVNKGPVGDTGNTDNLVNSDCNDDMCTQTSNSAELINAHHNGLHLHNKSSKPGANAHCSGDSDLEPISVIASDIHDFPTALASKVKKRSSKSQPKLSSFAGRSECSTSQQQPTTGSKSKFCELRSNMGDESVFTRPEFNSTLRIRREVEQLEETELDICEAVKSKLRASDRTRNTVEGKASSHVNIADLQEQQFRSLVAVDVHQEELVEQVATEETAKARPVIHKAGRLSQELQERAPDAFDFFTPDLQWETGNYRMDGLLPPPPSQLLTADLTHAFDVYRHIRAWEKW